MPYPFLRNIKRRWITVDGRKVFYRCIVPDNKRVHKINLAVPLICVHGLGCASDVWLPSMRRLAKLNPNLLVIAVDMPGYGYSKGPKQTLGIDELANWMNRFMDAIMIGTADFSGNSMGCQVIMSLARSNPERVRSMILTGPTTGGNYVSLSRYMAGLIADSFNEPFRYNLTLLRLFFMMGPLRYLQTVRNMMQDNPMQWAHLITIPAIVIRGSRDLIVPDRTAKTLAGRLPQGIYAEIRGCAHAVEFADSKAYVRVLLSFITDTHAVQIVSERLRQVV